MIIGVVQHPLPGSTKFQKVRQFVPLCLFHQALAHAQCLWRLGSHLASQRHDPRHQLILRHLFQHKSDLDRFLCVNQASGQRDFCRSLITDQALQKPGTTITGDDAKINERLTESGAFGTDPNIAHAGKVTAGTNRWAINSRDDGNLGAMQRQGNTLDALTVLAFQFQCITAEGALAVVTITVLHLLDIATGTERAAITGNYQYRNCRGAIGPFNGSDNVIDQGRTGQGVAQVIACKREYGNPILQLQPGIL
jgi:hypothetical protein